MSWMLALEAAQLGLGALGAHDAEKQAKEDAKQKIMLSMPWYNAGKEGLTGLSRLTNAYLLPRLDKESPFLAREHQLATEKLGQGRENALASSLAYWSPTGNTGRARGEELRINQAYDTAKANADLGYGEAQNAFKEKNLADYSNILQTQAGFGGPGLSTQIGAIDQRTAGVNAAGDALAQTLATIGQYYGMKAGSKPAEKPTNNPIVLPPVDTTLGPTPRIGGYYGQPPAEQQYPDDQQWASPQSRDMFAWRLPQGGQY